jgi:hypothetical protein
MAEKIPTLKGDERHGTGATDSKGDIYDPDIASKKRCLENL